MSNGLCRSGVHWTRRQDGRGPNRDRLEVVKHTEANRGFVLLPRRSGRGTKFAWAARFRRLARDYERLAATLGAFMSWPAPASCSQTSSGYSLEVNNRL